MPEPIFPPTPISSTDISGKDGVYSSHLDRGFNLPPAALDVNQVSTGLDRSTTAPHAGISSRNGKVSSASPSACQSLSPNLPVDASTRGTSSSCRRKTGSNNDTNRKISYERDSEAADGIIWRSGLGENNFNLPPPPTGSCKIIQMVPSTAKDTLLTSRESETISQNGCSYAQSRTDASKRLRGRESKTLSQGMAVSDPGNRTAGRKRARKTAHSLIERKRRLKMNEEFDILRNIIPACAGREMHKLTILQASVDYIRYLQQCITDLQGSRQPQGSFSTDPTSRREPSRCSPMASPLTIPASAKRMRRSSDYANDKGSNPRMGSSTMVCSDNEMMDLRSNSQPNAFCAVPASSSSSPSSALFATHGPCSSSHTSNDSVALEQSRCNHVTLCSPALLPLVPSNDKRHPTVMKQNLTENVSRAAENSTSGSSSRLATNVLPGIDVVDGGTDLVMNDHEATAALLMLGGGGGGIGAGSVGIRNGGDDCIDDGDVAGKSGSKNSGGVGGRAISVMDLLSS